MYCGQCNKISKDKYLPLSRCRPKWSVFWLVRFFGTLEDGDNLIDKSKIIEITDSIFEK